MKELNHNSNYEFLGSFWFVGKPEEALSGKLTYTPEHGIKLELINPFIDSAIKIKDVKIMQAALIFNGEMMHFTLFDVFLSPTTTYMGSISTQYIKGNARVLVGGCWLENKQIKSLDIEYDNNLNNIFYAKGEEIVKALQYEKKPVKTSIGTIKLCTKYWGKTISSKEDIDELLWAFPKDTKKLEKIRKTLCANIENDSSMLFKRTSSFSIVSFENGTKLFDNYLKTEIIWRSFWELLTDYIILINRCWIKVLVHYDNEKDKKYYSSYPVLVSSFISNKNRANIHHKNFLPLNIDSFGKEFDLSKIYSPFSKWIDINKDKRLNILIYGISKIIHKSNFINSDDYVSLISYIETTMNFLGNKETNINTIINKYSNNKWRLSIKKVIGTLPKKVNIATFLTEVRNVITHPKAAMKEGGVYINFAMNDFKLQASYACLVGLLIKAILQYLYNFDEKKVDEYIDKVIQARRFYKIKYK